MSPGALKEDHRSQFIAGILDHLQKVVGEGGAYAVLHYGALEEGRRIVRDLSPGSLDEALTIIDELLDQTSNIESDEGGTLRISVTDSSLLDLGGRPAEGLVLGVLEGAVEGTRGSRHKGVAMAGDGPGKVFELRGGGV